MIDMTNLTIMELANLYDKQTPEVQKWMLESMHLYTEKKKPNELYGFMLALIAQFNINAID